MGKFIKLPIEALTDQRLTKNELKVLAALYAFSDDKGACYPGKPQIAELTGIAVGKISGITNQLSAYGWVKKSGKGGRNQRANYQLKTSTDLVQNQHRFSAGKSPETSTDLVLRNKQTINTKEKVKKEKTSIWLESLPGTISKSAALEFIQHRKNKKAPLTQNAFDRAMSAAIKAANQLGITPDEAIHETIDAGWQGIKADWLAKRVKGETKNATNQRENSASRAIDNIERLTDPDFWKTDSADNGSGTVGICKIERQLWPCLVESVAGFENVETDSGGMGRQIKLTH